MVSTLHGCSYENSTISPVNKLINSMALLSFSPSFTFLSFTFLFNLFCFSGLCQIVVLLNLLDTKVNPNCLLLSERERENRRSPVLRRGGGRGGGAMVLGKLSVPRRPTNLDNSRTRAYCACNRCRWGLIGHFFSSLSFLFSFSLFGRRPDID